MVIIGGSLFDNVTSNMKIYKEEIFILFYQLLEQKTLMKL